MARACVIFAFLARVDMVRACLHFAYLAPACTLPKKKKTVSVKAFPLG
jgi:hypothetical protein